MTERGPRIDEEAALRLLVSGADALQSHAAPDCPDAATLAALVDGTVAAAERAGTEEHLSRCTACRTIVAALSRFQGVPDPRQAHDSAGSIAGAAPRAEPFPRLFGPYTLLRRIGGGGMGEVYEAEHRERGRREALKQLRPGLDADPRAAERFLREIRAAARVAHDHAVPVWDSGSICGVGYYTMPLLPGPSLEKVLDEIRDGDEDAPGRGACDVLDRHDVPAAPAPSPDPPTAYARRIAGALSGVASALAAIHGAGMVHRDVKPSNLVLDARRRLQLTDFGLVRFDASRITRAQETLGTPSYMAPEQLVEGAPVDGRADVYALGATLYEAVTLHRPFEGRTLAETVALILRGKVRPARAWNPALPRDLEVLVGRCFERRPEDRYADAASLARDLEAFSRGEPIAARPVPWFVRIGRAIVRRRAPLGIAAALVVALGVAAYLRPGRLTVRSLPTASLSLDGVEVGRTPDGPRDVAAGSHRVELRRAGFAPLDRAVEVGRGATYDLDVVLRAVDPADPETLKLLAAERGIERTEVTVSPERGTAPASRLAALLPRGSLRGPPAEVTLWADEPVREVTVRLESADDGGASTGVHSWEVATVFRQVRVAVPDAARARLVAGRWRLRIDGGGAPGAAAEFEILPADAANRVGAEIDAATRGFDADDPSAGFLRAEALLARGLFVETLAEAARLRQSLGDRREVARLVLAALERAGLRDVGPWFDWAATYLRAEK